MGCLVKLVAAILADLGVHWMSGRVTDWWRKRHGEA